MAFKTFAPGVLTSSDVNTFLMRQAVIVATSSTRPASPNEGMTIYETDTDRYKTYSGTAWEDGFKSGAWISYTPAVNSFGAGTDWALGNGTVVGKYQKVGRLVIGYATLLFGSTTTFGTKSLISSVPLTPNAPSLSNLPLGNTRSFDVSTGNAFTGHAELGSGTGLAPVVQSTSLARTTAENVTSTVPFTWVNGDYILITFAYEAAA
jgi:hypothetical protein